MSTQKTLKAAMVGMRHGHLGSFGPEKPGWHRMFHQLDGVEVVAYCEDTEPQKLDVAREFDPGAHFYDSVEDLIAHEDFDMACVALPPSEVPPTGIKLAEAGKHFVMEKQFARNSTDLAELVRAVRRNRVKVLPAYPWRFHPVAQDLRRIIEEGTLGRPLDIAMRMVTGQVRPGGRDPEHFVYRNETEGGGIMHMLGGHFLELMRFLMGCEVKAVQAMNGRPVGYIDEPLEDLCIAAFEYENGAFGSMHSGYLQRVGGGKDTTLIYHGLDGAAYWDPVEEPPKLEVKSATEAWKGTPERVFEYSLAPATVYGKTLWRLEWVQRFVQAIRTDQEPALTIDDALHVLQCIDATYESSRTGRRVEVKYGV